MFLVAHHDLKGPDVQMFQNVGVLECVGQLTRSAGYAHIWRLTQGGNALVRETEARKEGGYPCCRFEAGFYTRDLDSDRPYECKKCGARHPRSVIEEHSL
jgi:hypothetical protein